MQNTLKVIIAAYRTHSTAFKRSLSDGNILRESNRHVASAVAQCEGCLPENAQGGGNSFSKSTPELSACESDVSYCRSHFICIHLFTSIQI